MKLAQAIQNMLMHSLTNYQVESLMSWIIIFSIQENVGNRIKKKRNCANIKRLTYSATQAERPITSIEIYYPGWEL